MPTTARANNNLAADDRDTPVPPFLVVEYEDKRAIVSREAKYQETLTSIKKAFSALRHTPDEDIGINAHIEQIDSSCRITDGIWSEMLPRLSVVKVTLDGPTRPDQQQPNPTRPEEGTTAAATIYVRLRVGWNWNNPIAKVYTTHISLDRTGHQLVELIKAQENISIAEVLVRHNGADINLGATLTASRIEHSSVVEIVIK